MAAAEAIPCLVWCVVCLPRREQLEAARAEAGGLLYSRVNVGEHVSKGQEIALVTDPLGEKTHRIESPRTGVIVGLALNPLVRAGDPIANIVLCSKAKWKRAQSDLDGDKPEEESIDDEESLDDA